MASLLTTSEGSRVPHVGARSVPGGISDTCQFQMPLQSSVQAPIKFQV